VWLVAAKLACAIEVADWVMAAPSG
jgi:hypothetical protein